MAEERETAMSYFKSNGKALRGIGDDTGGATCRTGAAVFTNGNWWVPVKDASGKAYQLMQTNAILALPMCSSGSSSGVFDLLGKVVSGAADVIKAKVTPAPVTNISTSAGGMSTTTKVAVAGAAAVGLLLVLRRRKK